MIKAVFFDLDGTLLRIDEQIFTKKYLSLLLNKVSYLGYNKDNLVPVLFKGIQAMSLNDGSKTNEEAFFEVFYSLLGEDKRKDRAVFDDFYSHEFSNLKEVCEYTPLSNKIVKFVKSLNLKAYLSTNPYFPMNGQLTRINIAGMDHKDFDYITSYENFSYCKPNPMYFKTLLNKFNLKKEEVIVIGNNDYEDGDCASSLGIKVYLVKGYLIHSSNCHNKYEEIELNQVKDVILKEVQHY